MAGGLGEAVGQDRVVEDDFWLLRRAGLRETFRNAARVSVAMAYAVVLFGLGRASGTTAAMPWKGTSVAFEDEGWDAEALAFERIGLEVLRVWAGLSLSCRSLWCAGLSVRRGRPSSLPSHDAEGDGGVGDVASDGAGVVEQPVERRDACDGDQAACGEVLRRRPRLPRACGWSCRCRFRCRARPCWKVTAVTVPPDEPPGEADVVGVAGAAKELLRLVSLAAKSGMLVWPMMMAPAARRRATIVASRGAMSSWPGMV
jgi:hypothetical protein